MDWLKKNYDIALLGLGTLVILISSVFLFLEIQSGTAFQNSETNNFSSSTKTNEPNFAAISSAESMLANPMTWGDKSPKGGERGSLFVSRPYLVKEDKLIDPIEGNEQLHPPITNAWLIKYGLNYADSTIKDQDSDGDGFTNLEEFNADPQTDPRDKVSTPSSISKLKLVKFEAKPFRIEFKGDPSGEGVEFQINAKELKGSAKSQYKKIGEIIDGAPYKIIKYEKKDGLNDKGLAIDASELTIQNTDTDVKIVLVKNKEGNDPTSYGEFLNLLTNETIRLKEGDSFVMQPNNKNMKLIKISEYEAQIQDMASGKISTIGKWEY
jgi:hypothetical protein